MNANQCAELRRLMNEISSTIMEIKILREIAADIRKRGNREPHSKRGVVFHAMQNSIYSRLGRLLDRTKGAKSFLYVINNLQKSLVLSNFNGDLKCIDEISKKYKQIRDKTIAHIDAESVANSKKIWKDADITWNEADLCLDKMWKISKELYPAENSLQTLPPEFYDQQTEIIFNEEKQTESWLPM